MHIYIQINLWLDKLYSRSGNLSLARINSCVVSEFSQSQVSSPNSWPPTGSHKLVLLYTVTTLELCVNNNNNNNIQNLFKEKGAFWMLIKIQTYKSFF